MRTRVKFCGMTRAEDAELAAMLGADAIGLIFYPESKRFVDISKAKKIIAHLPPFISIVGLFVNAAADDVNQILEAIPINLLQFHGEESETFCQSFGVPYLKAIPMKNTVSGELLKTAYPSAQALLLDTYHSQVKGGSGESFNWEWIPKDLQRKIILAGGLTTDNVGLAINTVHPYGVDVCSGIEKNPGIKDYAKMQAFMSEVRYADSDKNE